MEVYENQVNPSIHIQFMEFATNKTEAEAHMEILQRYLFKKLANKKALKSIKKDFQI